MGEHERCHAGTTCGGAGCADLRCRVLASRAWSGATEEAREAVAAFCESSWPTVHGIVRRQGYRGADAEDLTQGYFARFLERGDLEYVASWNGCLRSFLRVSVRHFLSNERDRDRAVKRGGGRPLLSLDAAPLGPRAVPEPACAVTPETLLVHEQAERALEDALQRLRSEMQNAGCPERLARVEAYLLCDVNTGSYRRMANEWGVGESAARVAVHRLRRRLVALLRGVVARHLPRLRPAGGSC